VVSMDALFGLPRKKSAGKSFRQPLHGMLFFDDQDEVDAFVESAPRSKKQMDRVCIMESQINVMLLLHS